MSTKPAESVSGSARHLPRFLELREEGGAIYLCQICERRDTLQRLRSEPCPKLVRLVQRMEAEAEVDDPGPTSPRA